MNLLRLDGGMWDLSTKQLACTIRPVRCMGRYHSMDILIFPSEDRIAVVQGNRAQVWDLSNQQRLCTFREEYTHDWCLLVDDRLVMLRSTLVSDFTSSISVCSETETGEWNTVEMYRTNTWLEGPLGRSNESEILFLERSGDDADTLLKVKSLDVHDGTVRTNFEFNIAFQGFEIKVEVDFLICENKWLLILVCRSDPKNARFEAQICVCKLLDAHQYRLISFLRLRNGVHWTSMYQPPGCSKTICVCDIQSQPRVVSFFGTERKRSSVLRSSFLVNGGFVVISRSRVVARDRAYHSCVYNVETGER